MLLIAIFGRAKIIERAIEKSSILENFTNFTAYKKCFSNAISKFYIINTFFILCKVNQLKKPVNKSSIFHF